MTFQEVRPATASLSAAPRESRRGSRAYPLFFRTHSVEPATIATGGEGGSDALERLSCDEIASALPRLGPAIEAGQAEGSFIPPMRIRVLAQAKIIGCSRYAEGSNIVT